MAHIGERIERELGIEYKIFGLDSGTGMPAPRDYRDHPDLYNAGDFPMIDVESLRRSLPSNTTLLLGDIKDNVNRVLAASGPAMPIGFASIDVDYYSSTLDALALFEGEPEHYLPASLLYFDDTLLWFHNRWQGELLAIDEFNANHAMRKIDRAYFIKNSRLLRNAHWLDQIYVMHALDHPTRHRPRTTQTRVLDNPYLQGARRGS